MAFSGKPLSLESLETRRERLLDPREARFSRFAPWQCLVRLRVDVHVSVDEQKYSSRAKNLLHLLKESVPILDLYTIVSCVTSRLRGANGIVPLYPCIERAQRQTLEKRQVSVRNDAISHLLWNSPNPKFACREVLSERDALLSSDYQRRDIRTFASVSDGLSSGG